METLYPDLTDAERKVADYLSLHYREVTYANASQVARALELSASTLVRFAQKLGYRGYPELQSALQSEFENQHDLTALAPLDDSFLQSYIGLECRNLNLLAAQAELLAQAADLLANAQRVWVAGDRSSAHIASAGQHFMRMVRPEVHRFDFLPGDMPDALLDVGAQDAFLLVSMSRYSRRSLRLIEALVPRTPVVLLSDEHHSPLLPYARVTVRFASASVTALRSLTAGFSTMQALVMQVAQRNPASAQRLNHAEALWRDFGVFYQEE